MRAIHRLAEDGSPHAARWIRPLLRDREALVRSAALMALGKLGAPSDLDAIAELLQARMSFERRAAVDALVALHSPRMRDPLIRAMKTEPSYANRIEMIKALSVLIGDNVVVDTLISMLADPDEDVRATAAVALGKIGASQAILALQQMMLTDIVETTIYGRAIYNPTIAHRAIEMIRAPGHAPQLEWPT